MDTKSCSAVTAATEQPEAIMVSTNAPTENLDQTDLATHCKRCGRVLKSIESRKLGYGNYCYAKMRVASLKRPLFLVSGVKHADH